MSDTGRPDANGLLGNCDCMTLWTIRAAQAAGLEHEVLCAIMSEAQGLAEAGMGPTNTKREMKSGWPGVIFSLHSPQASGAAWVLYAGGAEYQGVPVAFSPTGWER
ncbi:MAG: hypothetical protein WC565_06410 [Parcubacteria group bacterium]